MGLHVRDFWRIGVFVIGTAAWQAVGRLQTVFHWSRPATRTLRHRRIVNLMLIVPTAIDALRKRQELRVIEHTDGKAGLIVA